jgi:SAM-dependent methyltransferase
MSLADRVSAYNRNRKWELFLKHMLPDSGTTILDVGFNATEYSDVDNYIEKHYKYPENITALGMDSPAEFQKRYPKVRAVQYDGNEFPFEDQKFDVCWSNAVIEHVGNRERQLKFLKEVKRVARRAIITTPNRLFPIEVHTRIPFLHWLPKPWFDGILRSTPKYWAAGDYMHLLTYRQLSDLLAEAGADKPLIHKNRLCGFVVDFVAVF